MPAHNGAGEKIVYGLFFVNLKNSFEGMEGIIYMSYSSPIAN